MLGVLPGSARLLTPQVTAELLVEDLTQRFSGRREKPDSFFKWLALGWSPSAQSGSAIQKSTGSLGSLLKFAGSDNPSL